MLKAPIYTPKISLKSAGNKYITEINLKISTGLNNKKPTTTSYDKKPFVATTNDTKNKSYINI